MHMQNILVIENCKSIKDFKPISIHLEISVVHPCQMISSFQFITVAKPLSGHIRFCLECAKHMLRIHNVVNIISLEIIIQFQMHLILYLLKTLNFNF